MKSDEKLWSICVDIYREAFAKSEPSLDFDKVLEKAKKKPLKERWFLDHYLSPKRWEVIVEAHIKKNKLRPHERKKVFHKVYLGCGPTGSLEAWENRRKEKKEAKL